MKLIEQLRRTKEWSKLETAQRARIAPSTYTWIETGRFIPYPVMLARCADALGWTGEPQALLEDVPE